MLLIANRRALILRHDLRLRDQFAQAVKAFPLCSLIKTSLEVPHGASPRRYYNGAPKNFSFNFLKEI